MTFPLFEMFFLKNLLKLGGGAAAKKFQDEEKPFLEHLEDLRGTLFKIIITVIVSTVLAFIFNKQLIGVLQYPLNLAGIDKIPSTFGPVEGFMGVLKICLYAGLICSFPLILYFIGEFIIPGLTDKEKKLVIPVVLTSFVLFGAGVLFAYFAVIPRALEFFIAFGEERNIMMDLRFKYAVSFVTMMCIVFGLCFELPVVVMTLVKLDLLNSTMMRNTRSYAIVAMFIVAAVVTPTPDIFTMSLLAGPMIILYEICIWLAWWMERKAARAEAAEKERERQALLERQRRNKQRAEAEEAKAKDEPKSESEIREAPPGTLPYEPGNEAVYDEDESTADDEHASEPEYDSGLGDVGGGEPTPPDDSDAVWDRPSEASESDHAEDPYGHGHGDDNHWDHDYHADDHHFHDDYYSGPTEELKRMLREELKADLKEIIKVELREEILAEIREELRRDSGEGS